MTSLEELLSSLDEPIDTNSPLAVASAPAKAPSSSKERRVVGGVSFKVGDGIPLADLRGTKESMESESDDAPSSDELHSSELFCFGKGGGCWVLTVEVAASLSLSDSPSLESLLQTSLRFRVRRRRRIGDGDGDRDRDNIGDKSSPTIPSLGES